MSRNRRLLTLLTGMLAIGITGCPTFREHYGYSYSFDGTKSINGVAGFREMFELAGWETGHIKRLSPRANKYDAIVWFPTEVSMPSDKATQWFNDWLKAEPRTLVFVARGFPSSSRDYYRATRPNAAPSQRLEYRRREAREAISPWSIVVGDLSNGWVKLKVGEYSEATRFEGPWSDTVEQLPESLNSRVSVYPFDAKKDATLIAGQQAKTRNMKFDPLLSVDGGPALVARITSSDWPKSQIIVCNSAEYLLNFQLIDPRHQELAGKLITECGDQGKVAFFRSDVGGARVSGEDDGDLASGLELLRIWPLSIITVHAFGIAILACMILLPIFGRPQRLPKRSSADMRDHIVAIAELMERTQDSQYARERISDYFVHVRGDDTGPWVLPDRPLHSTMAPPNRGSQTTTVSDHPSVESDEASGDPDLHENLGNQHIENLKTTADLNKNDESNNATTHDDRIMTDRSESDKPDPEKSVD